MEKDFVLIKRAVIALFVSSFSLILSFFGDLNGSIFNVIIGYMVGVLFWGGLIAGYVMLSMLRKRRNEYSLKDSDFSNLVKRNKGISVLKFASNKQAFYFDVSMGISFILALIFLFVPGIGQGIFVVLFAIFLFSLHMHCLPELND